MLVRLLIAVQDVALGRNLAAMQDDVLAIEVAPPDTDLMVSAGRNPADLIVTDGVRIGCRPGTPGFEEAIHALRRDNAPNLIYLVRDESPESQAVALAGGCLTVLHSSATVDTLVDALQSVVHAWRETALQLQEAERSSRPMQLGDFVSRSPGMAQMMRVARRVAGSNSTVLILGETGVGKERLASAIHAEGPRQEGPFVVVNCGAIPESLIESELFGHEKGSFTGAHRTHRGHFEMAHGGTIFLDEIGELPLPLQVKLLRVLQERNVQRLGAEATISIDVRVLTATNRDLKEEIAAGRFRSDLYYRIGVVTLTIPPLRERSEDIPLMVQTYLDRFREEMSSSAQRVAEPVMDAFLAYSWPGNVREVINVLERATLLCETNEISLDDLPEEIAGVIPGPSPVPELVPEPAVFEDLEPRVFDAPLREAKRAFVEAFERKYFDQLLRETKGRINETAQRAGIDPRSLYDKMRRLGLRKEDYK